MTERITAVCELSFLDTLCQYVLQEDVAPVSSQHGAAWRTSCGVEWVDDALWLSLSYSWGFHRPIQQLFILGRWSIFTLEHYARKLYCLLRVSRGIRPVYISVTFVGKWDFPQPQGTCAQEASPQICMGTPCLPDLRAWALFTTTW